MDETPFLCSIAKIVRMHQKLALFWRSFLMDHRYIWGCLWTQKFSYFLLMKLFYKVLIKSQLVTEENSYYMWMFLSLIVLSFQVVGSFFVFLVLFIYLFYYSIGTDLKTLSKEDSFWKLNFVFALLLTYPSKRAETKIRDEQERFCLLV